MRCSSASSRLPGTAAVNLNGAGAFLRLATRELPPLRGLLPLALALLAWQALAPGPSPLFLAPLV